MNLKKCPFRGKTLKKLNDLIAEHPRDTGCILDGFGVRIMSPNHIAAWNKRADED